MRLWNEARVALYDTLQQKLPRSIRNWIGASILTAPVRRMLLWPNALGRLVESEVEFHGHRFRFAAPVKMASTVRRDGGIENGLCRLIVRECQPGAIAVDVGANYGFVSLVMASAVGASGCVHAFEANAEIFEGLTSNIDSNALRDR